MNSKLEMDEINEDPCSTNRNKRKYEHEVLDLHASKHACLEKSSTPETCFPSNIKSDIEDLKNSRKERSTDNNNNNNSHSMYDQIEQRSEKDSNSFSEDADSVMSASVDSKNELHYLKICPPDQNSSASVNWGSRLFDSSVNNLDRLEMKECDEISLNPVYNLYESPSFEEQEMDCGNVDEFDSSEYENGGTKPLEDLLCSNGVIPDTFILSSGRWNVNQDTEQGTEKMTIDKEFEQYFSMLML